MKIRSIIFYWLLILIPAFVIGLVAFKLLSHEQERINNMAIASARDRARTVGETLQITVESVEDELTASLRGISEDKLEAVLLEWEQNNPLIRNVFIWDESSGLVYPERGYASTSEERSFISRFDGLFSGRISWPSETYLETDGSVEKQDERQSQSLLQDIRKLRKGKEELVSIAKNTETGSAQIGPDDEDELLNAGGWIPWFAENRLYILGWVKTKKNGPVYGVELELMTLLSRLITNFPQSLSDDGSYALVDDAGHVLHQTGSVKIGAGPAPDITISLAPHLPHWELVVFMSGRNSLVQSGRGFMILAGLILGIFIITIITGGSLLTWQAHRNMMDARQKTSFVSNVSHELKTPLTSIRMYAELLSAERVKDPDKKSRYLQVIVAESQRLTRLVNNVLDFGRLEQGCKKYHLQEIDLVVYLNEFIESHSLRIREAGLEFKTDFQQERFVVWTDRDAIEQVLLNLIDNAIKYASAGGELNISLTADNDYCEIRVEDRGPGVSEANRGRIFEKFHRVDDSLTSKQQGAGLGLSIALRILKDLGGDIIYKPRENGGSSFIVRVPLNKTGGSVVKGRGKDQV